jgi:hypothetical protein
MFGVKINYRPDRSRQEAVIERMRKAIRREALKALSKKEKEKRNANS